MKIGLKEPYLKIIKNIFYEPIIPNNEKLKVFSLQIGTKHCPLLFSIVLEILAREKQQEKAEIGYNRKQVKLSLFTDNMFLYIEDSKSHQKTFRANKETQQSCRLQKQNSKNQMHSCTPILNLSTEKKENNAFTGAPKS